MQLPGWVLAIDRTVVGAATCIVLVPGASHLLRVHALSFGTDRLNLQRLVAANLYYTIEVASRFIRANHERVEVLWRQHLPQMARLRLIRFLYTHISRVERLPKSTYTFLLQVHNCLIIDRRDSIVSDTRIAQECLHVCFAVIGRIADQGLEWSLGDAGPVNNFASVS